MSTKQKKFAELQLSILQQVRNLTNFRLNQLVELLSPIEMLRLPVRSHVYKLWYDDFISQPSSKMQLKLARSSECETILRIGLIPLSSRDVHEWFLLLGFDSRYQSTCFAICNKSSASKQDLAEFIRQFQEELQLPICGVYLANRLLDSSENFNQMSVDFNVFDQGQSQLQSLKKRRTIKIEQASTPVTADPVLIEMSRTISRYQLLKMLKQVLTSHNAAQVSTLEPVRTKFKTEALKINTATAGLNGYFHGISMKKIRATRSPLNKIVSPHIKLETLENVAPNVASADTD